MPSAGRLSACVLLSQSQTAAAEIHNHFHRWLYCWCCGRWPLGSQIGRVHFKVFIDLFYYVGCKFLKLFIYAWFIQSLWKRQFLYLCILAEDYQLENQLFLWFQFLEMFLVSYCYRFYWFMLGFCFIHILIVLYFFKYNFQKYE